MWGTSFPLTSTGRSGGALKLLDDTSSKSESDGPQLGSGLEARCRTRVSTFFKALRFPSTVADWISVAVPAGVVISSFLKVLVPHVTGKI